MNLIGAVFLLIAALVIIWETLLAGPSARTFLAIVMVITSIVLIRRWVVGETT